MADQIEIFFNGESEQVPAGSTLQDLLTQKGIQALGTACAVNSEIVPKDTWAQYKLSASMQIDVFSVVAGG